MGATRLRILDNSVQTTAAFRPLRDRLPPPRSSEQITTVPGARSKPGRRL